MQSEVFAEIESNHEFTQDILAMEWDDTHLNQYHVIRRNGQLSPFNVNKIIYAMTRAFLAVEGNSAVASSRIHSVVRHLANQVVNGIFKRLQEIGFVHIEDIQDQVELTLMRAGEHKVARAYVLYREQHAHQRAARKEQKLLHVIDKKGNRLPLAEEDLRRVVAEACIGLEDVSPRQVVDEGLRNLFDGMLETDVSHTLIMSARSLIEKEPNYSQVAARLLLGQLRQEALNFLQLPAITTSEMNAYYPKYFKDYVTSGIQYELLTPALAEFDLDQLGKALVPTRDLQFTYLGLQTLYDRYFLQWEGTRFELPQTFFMRIAMGLALHEKEREARAIEFYEQLSRFDFICSTPTLFNAGTLRPQLSSCYLTTVPDDLEGIFEAIKNNALLSKFAGGLGNDWTYVRGMGARIKSTNGKSQGVVPFMKVANDTLVACNQSGKRRGSGCAYLETWHIDIEEFLELRKNTGDERRRTHDMNTANWIPDEFMLRVMENRQWTLFSPHEVPELHDLYGEAFKAAYERYEQAADEGKIKLWKRISAVELWRKMLSMLFETGHPWITFKDPCNLRNPQQHVGVVHSSNLCTEICLNTDFKEISVCNLASINLSNHINNGELDTAKLQRTIRTGMRMLDNVIDINYYAVKQAQTANLRHRPVGLGLMGFQDALYQLRLPYASLEAVEFADKSMELISYYAILASTELAEERGTYATYADSLWSQGILPIDSISRLAKTRGQYLEMSTSSTLPWQELRQRVQQVGMRNSNCMAIAPTATISNICGVTQSIEPTYQNLFIKSNLSGEFTVINPYLVRDLKALGLWDEVMINDLKYNDGSLRMIERVPAELKQLYATAFEIEPTWLIEAASKRQKWIDQSQSLNLYLREPSGRRLDQLYKLAWLRGLKTTYYLRTMGATRVQKSTVPIIHSIPPQACAIDDSECEVCQ
jgi:ribonucleoside-diphosphate reductase alpha chain